MAQRTQLRLNAMSGTFGTADGQLNDQLVAAATGSVDADDLGEILSHVASAVKRIHGHNSFTEQLPGQFSQTLFPATDDAFDLGKASNAWKDIYLEGDVIMSDAGEIKTSAGDLTISANAGSNDVIITGDLVPAADDTHDLGTASAAWQDLHLEGDVLMTDAGTIQTAAGDLTIDADAGKVVVQAAQAAADAIVLNAEHASGGVDLSVAGTAILSLDADSVDLSQAMVISDASGLTLGAGGDEFSISESSDNVTLKTLIADKDMIFKVNDGSADTEVFRLDGDVSALLVASGKQIQFGDAGENISGDGTDMSVASSNNLNITATNKIVIDAQGTDANDGVEISLGTDTADAKFIVQNNTGDDGLVVDGLKDVTVGRDLAVTRNVVVTGDLTVNGQTTTVNSTNTTLKDRIFAIASGSSPGDVDSGIIFTRSTADLGGGSDKKHGALLFDGAAGNAFKLGVTNDDGEGNTLDVADDDLADLSVGKVMVDGTANHMDVLANVLTLTAGTSFEVASVGDIVLDSGGDIVIDGTTQKLEFGSAGSGEHIVGDGTDLTVASGAKINLTATSDVHIPQGVGLVFDTAGTEKIESDGTDLSISVGAGGDVNLGADIGLTFGDDGEKIEGNGTRLTIQSGNGMFLDSEGTMILDADNGIISIDDGGVNQAALVSSAGAFAIAANKTFVLSSSMGVFQLQDDGASFGQLLNIGGNMALSSSLHNGDIEFHGNSGALIMKLDGSAGSLLMDTTKKIEFNDAGTAIHSSENGQLDLASDGTMVDSILANAANGGIKLNAGLDGDAAAIHLDSASGVTIAGGDQNDDIYIENSPLKLEAISAPTSTGDKLYHKTGGGLYWGDVRLDVSSTSVSKSVFKMVGNIGAGSNISGDAGATAVNVSAVGRPDQLKFIDVYVNGQLMVSGSETERSSGAADYHMIGTAAGGNDNAAEFQFGFGLEADDVVQVLIK